MPSTLRSAKLRQNAADSQTPPRTPGTPDIARMRETASKRFLTNDTEWEEKRKKKRNDPVAPRRFTIDLSLPPEQRYLEVCAAFKDEMRNLRFLFDDVVGTIVKFLPNAVIHWICWILLRGLWNPEETAELMGISKATGVEMYLLVCFNVLLDLLMGCSSGGAVVSDPRSGDGGKKMVHFRTLDWGMPALRKILVQLDYKLEPEGEIIASTINYAGFVGTLTGVRKDLSLSLNFRGVHNDMDELSSNVRYYGHHLMVFLGLRQSITSILRSYMVPRSPRGGRVANLETQMAQLPSYADVIRRVSCVDAPLVTSACYLCFSNGNTTTVFEKDLRTAKGRTRDDFLVITNVDVPEDGSDPISPKTNPDFTQNFAEIVAEAKDRRQCAEHNWRNLRLKKAQEMSDEDFAKGNTEVQVHVEDIISLVQKYPTTNESTHFACVMDPKEVSPIVINTGVVLPPDRFLYLSQHTATQLSRVQQPPRHHNDHQKPLIGRGTHHGLLIGVFLLLAYLTQARVSRSSGFPSSTKTIQANDPHATSLNTNLTILDFDSDVSPPPSRGRHRRQVNKIKQPPPSTDQELEAAASKGCNMLYMMTANGTDALTRLKALNPMVTLTDIQSKWNNAGALSDYGWTVTTSVIPWAYMGVNDMLTGLSLDKADTNNKNYQVIQDQKITRDGKTYAISKGTYDQAINPVTGLVIAYYIYSPGNEMKKNNIKGGMVPLEKYSDVLFLQYSKLTGRAKTDVKGLKYFVFLNIENVETWSVVVKALMNAQNGSKDLPKWPGLTFGMDTQEGKALLSTQIGAPLAWLLIQHKQQFGLKNVEKAQVWRNTGMTNQDTDQPYPNLLFHVKDVDPAVGVGNCGPEDSCCCPKV